MNDRGASFNWISQRYSGINEGKAGSLQNYPPAIQVYPDCYLLGAEDVVAEGNYVYTKFGWKTVMKGDAAIGLLVGECKVSRPHDVAAAQEEAVKTRRGNHLLKRMGGWNPRSIKEAVK